MSYTVYDDYDYTEKYDSLPHSPRWGSVKYKNRDMQPDEEFAIEKRAEFIACINYLLKIHDISLGITKLEMKVQRKRSIK